MAVSWSSLLCIGCEPDFRYNDCVITNMWALAWHQTPEELSIDLLNRHLNLALTTNQWHYTQFLSHCLPRAMTHMYLFLCFSNRSSVLEKSTEVCGHYTEVICAWPYTIHNYKHLFKQFISIALRKTSWKWSRVTVVATTPTISV